MSALPSELPDAPAPADLDRPAGTRRRPRPRTDFLLPPELEATRPPAERGLARDQVRLLVAGPGGGTQLARFAELARFLTAADLVVINTSATVNAALDGRTRGGAVAVHVCAAPPADHVVELRRPDGHGPVTDAARGDVVTLPGGARLRLLTGYPDATVTRGSRLWRAAWTLPAGGPGVSGVSGVPGVPDRTDFPGVAGLLAAYGRPIRYGHLRSRPPLAAYQTIYADRPGSAEAVSAGLPFSGRVLARLAARGVGVAPIVLHTGVSSPEAGEPPLAERYAVPAGTARAVNQTRAAGGRVVAVGTTVVRALESAARPGGHVVQAGGWTELVLGPDRPARVVDGLITGWHEPGASHLLLLEAVAGAQLVERAYREALAARLLWHEFGDSCLLLPRRTFHAAVA
jgi:S-adenosylmethionine:tRNA ribosyltransferase-isomerase